MNNYFGFCCRDPNTGLAQYSNGVFMSVSLIRTPFQLFYLNNPITGLKQYIETFYLLNAGLEKIWYLFVSSTRIPALLKSYILSFLWLIGIKKVIEVQIVFLIFTCGTKVLKQVVNLSCFLWNTGLKMPPNPHPKSCRILVGKSFFSTRLFHSENR